MTEVKSHEMASARSPSPDRYVIEAVDRALQLLEILAQDKDLGVTEIAKRLRVSKALVFRLLHTLERRGYVVRDPEHRTNALGYRLLYLADSVEHQSLLVSAAKPLMDDLAQICRENVNFLVRDGLHSLCVATRESPHQIRLFAQVGRRGPLHAGGASKVLLAFAPAEIQEAVLRSELPMYTPHTITNPIELEQVLARIRADGYHHSANDLDDGAFSIAAPVYGNGAQIVAALSIAGPVSRCDAQAVQHHRRLVLDYAVKLSTRLGGVVPPRRVAIAS